MRKNLFIFLLFLQLFLLKSSDTSLQLSIYRSESHEDQTGTLTPLVISLSSDDIQQKTTAADLIFVVDVSGSMGGTRINLVKETLNYIVDITNENDSIALITFHTSATLRQGLLRMTEENKNALRAKIKDLTASGGTNIYSGLKLGLQQVKKDYSSKDRVCSIILLSDGKDQKKNAETNFDTLIKSGKKKDYIFTTHSFGYGASHDAVLMSSISKIRDGGYFFIKEITGVKSAFIKIYGTLSTIVENNLHLRAQSLFRIESVNGMDDMYQSSLTKEIPYTFDVDLLHVIGGKTYSFVALLDIPEDTPYGTEVLNATIVGKNKTANYLWDNDYHPAAYEEYIRTIVFDFIDEGYSEGQRNGVQTIENSITWVEENYEGNFNWEGELTETKQDFNNFNTYGKANILSKLRELKSQKVGNHFSQENTFVDELIKNETDKEIQISDEKKINSEQIISTEKKNNYYYFYLKEGKAKINGTHFSGEHSSMMIYTSTIEKINIEPLTPSFDYFYQAEKKTTRIQNWIDMGRGGKFIFNKDFPFDFYTRIDGKNDVLFNIQFLNLEYTDVQNEFPSFEINAYIIPEKMIKTLKSKNYNTKPSSVVYSGYYEKSSRIGKIFIKKEDISKNIDYNSVKNFIYIIVQKTSASKIIYRKVEGQFSFTEMNYRSRNIPEGFYIFNNLLPGQKNPHQYTILLDPIPGKKTRIEFAASGNELNCKVLKYNSYVLGSEELYTDYSEFEISRESKLGKTYIYVTQSSDPNNLIKEVILSIFSSNKDYIASNDYSQLEYSLRYMSESDYGLIEYYNENNFEFNIGNIEGNQEKIKIDFYPIKSKYLNSEEFIQENNRFYLKAFAYDKTREEIKGIVSLFDKNIPDIVIEKNKETNSENNILSINLDIDRSNNYLLALYAISQTTGEILGYQTKKLYKTTKNIIITDNNSFENEYKNEVSLEFKVSQEINKTHLILQVTDLEDGESVTIKALIDDKIYEGQNKVQIPKANCKGKDIKIDINLNYEEKETEYYLKIYMDNKVIIESDIKNMLTKALENYLQENSENPKIFNLNNGNILVLSSILGKQETKISLLNKEGNLLKPNSLINLGYSSDAILIQPYNLDNYYVLIYHNKEDLSNNITKEIILTMKDDYTIIKNITLKNDIYQQISGIPLLNGNILIIGITKEKITEINIYNPKTGVIGDGINIDDVNIDDISCYEQTKNYINCIYSLSDNKNTQTRRLIEDENYSKLRIKQILVDTNTLTESTDREIKSFNIKFDYLKAIPYNENEGIILFQNKQDLYYFHIKTDKEDDNIQIKRYEYLYNNCAINNNNAEDESQTSDIAILSPYKVFVVCETVDNKFKGFIIHQNQKKIDEFDFNIFEANEVKSPIFAKFGNSLGLFYTSVDNNSVKSIKYHILNYPDCIDFSEKYFILPKNYVREINFLGKVFLSNPYPSDLKQDIKVRFNVNTNISFIEKNSNNEILSDIDYPAGFTFVLKSGNNTGLSYIEYTATREDELDGIFIGKTCKIPVYTPECLDQCESCTDIGSEDHHMCLGCKDGPYYYEADPDIINEGNYVPHNCKECDISCVSCYGGFLQDNLTTNCKECDLGKNYYPHEDDLRTCISQETKDFWEKSTEIGLYLDSTPGEEHKDQWRWRKCHKNCATCEELGDDLNNKCTTCKEGLYFYFNQTLENKGIPGSCYEGIEGNGYYLAVDDDVEKLYPCSKNCKKCSNDNECLQCEEGFFKTNNEYDNETICVSECGYCLAEDRINWECVNCKTDFPEPRYTLNKTCVKEIPYIEFLGKYHHIIDDKCNLLHGCKEGCNKCKPWYSDNCTECDSSYYEEDHSNKEKTDTFHCFTEETCKGNEPYIHDKEKQIAGIPELIDNKKVCINCKLHNNQYRLPNEYKCGNKLERTYIENNEYNKLSYCYYKCQECDYWGNAVVMNCSSCRDPSVYSELVQIGDYYNCYRKSPKCGMNPYYHDFDLGDKLGLDDCGEECDICMNNFTCPENLSYMIVETKECVEYCSLTDILDKTCEFLDQNAAINLLENPWGLKNKNDLINSTINLNYITSNKLSKYINKKQKTLLNTEKNQTSEVLNNYIGSGEIYNLKESKIISRNNIKLEFTSVKLENQKLNKLLSGEINEQENQESASVLDLTECEKLLKKEYNLKGEEDLIIIKEDILDDTSKYYALNRTEYKIFSTSLGIFLPLSICKEAQISIQTYNRLNTSLLGKSLQFKSKAVLEDDYNLFDPNSEFYNDVCSPFTNENGNDVLLSSRRKEYFNEEFNLCEQGCDFLGYNESNKVFECNCSIKNSVNEKSTYQLKAINVPDEFYDKKEEYSNIKVIKCASNVFSIQGQKMNLGSYILIFLFICLTVSCLYYFIKGRKNLTGIFEGLNKVKEDKDKINVDSNKKNEGVSINDGENNNNADDIENIENIDKIEKDFVMSEEDLNSVDYYYAKNHDKRNYCEYYLSLLKMKQFIIFTFYTSTDHNLRVIKITLFILLLVFNFGFTALFFSDNILNNIYLNKGAIKINMYIINIILSSLCCLVINFLIRFIFLSENDIHKINKEKNPIFRDLILQGLKRKIKIKFIILYIISFIFMIFCWYYVTAFCAVFKNTQGHFLINVLCVFIICNLWAFITSLIAPILRIKSLKNGDTKASMYKISKILAYF